MDHYKNSLNTITLPQIHKNYKENIYGGKHPKSKSKLNQLLHTRSDDIGLKRNYTTRTKSNTANKQMSNKQSAREFLSIYGIDIIIHKTKAKKNRDHATTSSLVLCVTHFSFP